MGLNDWPAIETETLYAQFGERIAFWIFAILAWGMTSRRARPQLLQWWVAFRIWLFVCVAATLNNYYFLSTQTHADKLMNEWWFHVTIIPFACFLFMGIALVINLLLENIFQRTSGRRSR